MLSSNFAAFRGHLGSRGMSSRPPTAVVMMNMGGPSTQEEVHPFLHRLFTDRQIMQLPMQNILGAWIAKRRSPKIMKQYAEIGGGSPIWKWTEIQGKKLEKRLDELCPESAPHKSYIAFRRCDCSNEEGRRQESDSLLTIPTVELHNYWVFAERTLEVKSILGPQCVKAELLRCLRESGMQDEFQWSIIDRWHSHPSYIEALAGRIVAGLNQFPVEDQKKAGKAGGREFSDIPPGGLSFLRSLLAHEACKRWRSVSSSSRLRGGFG
eukprot:763255-Hanusia_phi.AAC.2